MDKLVTIIGGGGFIGRYAARELARAGWRIRIAAREPKAAFFVRPQAALGQLSFATCDIRNAGSVARAVDGSDAVVNLVGILKGNFQAFHVDGARHVAEAAAQAGAETLVHVSAIGADPASASDYAASKGEGEAAVRAAFPQATILRPSIVFGPEDDFVNRFARLQGLLPVVPIVRPEARFQPVYVRDVAQAVAAAVSGQGRGETFELGGPEEITMDGLNRRIAGAIGRKAFLPLPDALTGLMAKATGWLPFAPITHDQWTMLGVPSVARGPGLKELGITPTPLDAVTDGWLVQYRRHGRFTADAAA
ncbi:NADH dehydrogenase (Ubiquinone) 1 alpha subcomplex 9 [Sphingomonas antarctica]|uniref:complex I NDUFA9 subunit family protein n=1 Tax=Sphingomonas antarctica TaxID=2040274 RepID=UPI0039EBFDB0